MAFVFAFILFACGLFTVGAYVSELYSAYSLSKLERQLAERKAAKES